MSAPKQGKDTGSGNAPSSGNVQSLDERRPAAPKRRDPLMQAVTLQSETIPTIGEIGLNQFAPYMLNRLSASWNGELSEALKEMDLTTTKFRALAVLAVASGITVNELALFAVTEQSTMSRTLDVLEEQHLVARRSKLGDLRTRQVFITEKGVNLFTSLWPRVYNLYRRFFEGVNDTEFQSFLATLQKVLCNVRDHGG